MLHVVNVMGRETLLEDLGASFTEDFDLLLAGEELLLLNSYLGVPFISKQMIVNSPQDFDSIGRA